jgi:hypothetical protein
MKQEMRRRAVAPFEAVEYEVILYEHFVRDRRDYLGIWQSELGSTKAKAARFGAKQGWLWEMKRHTMPVASSVTYGQEDFTYRLTMDGIERLFNKK